MTPGFGKPFDQQAPSILETTAIDSIAGPLSLEYTSNTDNATSTKNPSNQFLLAQDQMETKAGDLWSTKREGDEWPIVICDEEMIQSFFKRRPESARQVNGNWLEDYKIGGKLHDKRCFPALILGIVKL